MDEVYLMVFIGAFARITYCESIKLVRRVGEREKVSEQKERFVCIASHLFQTHLCDAQVPACVCMYTVALEGK